MNDIKKVSEITWADVADYLRLDVSQSDTSDIQTLGVLISVSKAYISGYTGLTLEEMDEHPDFIIVVLILCQSMWDERTMYVDSKNLNKVIETILGLHRKNFV